MGLLAILASSSAPGQAENEDYEPNVLEARTAVSRMAEQTLNMLEHQVVMTGVVGWAAIAPDPTVHVSGESPSRRA